MQGKQVVNSLNKGMSLDNDVQYVDKSTYCYSMNGSLIYNKDGTYSWKSLKGNKVSISIGPNNGTSVNPYKIIGSTGSDNLTVLFLVDEVNNNSEIGLFSLNANGTGIYKTLFNDINDPNGDTLNFSSYNQIEARYLFENPNLIRSYWVDGVRNNSNQPRTITFKYDSTLGSDSIASSYVSTTLSVHAINSQAEFSMGLIKYMGVMGGGLLSGIYQYIYRLQTIEGYLTPWYPASNKIIVSASAKNATNSNLYEYSQSGLATSIGNIIQIKGVDTRFDKIDVAYMYTDNSSTIIDARIFAQVDITGNIMNFNHLNNNGEPLIIDEITTVYSGLRKAKTLNIKDSTLYYGNVIEGVLFDFNIEDVISGATLKPILRDMRSDVYPDAVGAIPLEASVTSTFKTRMTMHTDAGGEEEYDVVNDYSNYDGTQIDHLYTGYWRGETYRIAIVFYDKLGFQSFAYHLGDIKFPEQSEDGYSWNRVREDGVVINNSGTLSEKAWPTNNFGEYISKPIIHGENTANRNYSHLRIMGLQVSGIDISSIKDQISGFKIVRTRTDKTILLQGLLMPCVFDGVEVFPMPTSAQSFSLLTGSVGDEIASGQNPSGFRYLGLKENDTGDLYKVRSQVSTLYAPYYDFTGVLPTLQSNDNLHLVGGCWGPSNAGGSGSSNYNHFFIEADHAFTKYHYSKNNYHFGCLHPYPRYNDKINLFSIQDAGPQSELSLAMFGSTFKNYNNIVDADVFGFTAGFELENYGKYNTIVIEHENIYPEGWTPASFLPSPMYRTTGIDKYGNNPVIMGSFIANYKRPNNNPYGGLTTSSLATSIFYSTGHFQPVNNQTFTSPLGDIYNDIEVWGGDCYLDYHTQLRLYADAEDSTPNPGGSYDDYAVGVSFPLEMNVNHRLRYSNSSPKLTYPNVGSRPSRSVHGTGFSNFSTGLYMDFKTTGTTVIEQFNINLILFFEEVTFFYFPKPVEWLDNTHYPVRWRFTPTKFYGDIVDTWRTFQVNDFRDLDGKYGEITSSVFILNQIYSLQKSAFGRLRASDRAMIESATVGSLTTGVGDKLDGIDYISTEYGNQHQWSLFKSDNSFYWVENNKSKLMRFGQDGKLEVSDIAGVHQFIAHESPYFNNNDNPVNNSGITGAYDFDNNIAWFVFKRDRQLRSVSNVTDITINSRAISGNHIDYPVIEQGDTAIINWTYGTATNFGVVIPFNDTSTSGENIHKYFYLMNNATAVKVYVDKNNSKTLLLTMQPQEHYVLFRNNVNDDWSFLLVTRMEIADQRSTILYSEVNNAVIGFEPINPSFILSHKNKIMSVDYDNFYTTNNSLYINSFGTNGQVYNEVRRSIVDIPVNDAALLPKIFDSIRINCNKYFANKLIEVILTTDNQYIKIDLANDDRSKYLEDVLRFPLRSRNQTDRTRGKVMIIRLILDNSINGDDLLSNILTYYRPSNRY